MHYIRNVSRVLVGIVFIFSGFVKAIDPLGSAYKFGDYFSAFGLDFLSPLALPLAIFLSSIEFTMGLALLISYRMRLFSWAVLVFMSFFTILTFILAIYNPVTDCGCFGDALILTNWETFWKNLIILVFVLLVFYERNHFQSVRKVFIEWIVISLIFISVSWLSVYSLNHLPPLDFRPFSVGSNLPQKMIVPPDAPRDVYETTLIYKNRLTGGEEEFSMEDFPKDTSMYSFVDARSKLVTKGYEPPVHDFSISALGGTDITDVILRDPGYSLLLVSHDLSKADKNGLMKAEQLARFSSLNPNITFYCLTASTSTTIYTYRDDMNLSFEFYQADEITLKTIVRSNPGLLLMKNGTILGKWHYNDFPEPGLSNTDFRGMMENYPFIPGTDLQELNNPPPGAMSDVYETILTYRNIVTDSISSFTIENFPQSPEWAFVNSQTRLVKEGFKPPLGDFKPITPEGNDLAPEILNSADNVLLMLVRDPQTIDPELLNRVNNLSVATSGNDATTNSFYMLTQLEREDLIDFGESFISPITLATLEGDYIDRIANEGIALIWIRNRTVMDIRKNNSIPSPSGLDEFLSSTSDFPDADTILLPSLLESYRVRWEKRFVYLLIIGLISFGLLLRVFFERGRKEG